MSLTPGGLNPGQAGGLSTTCGPPGSGCRGSVSLRPGFGSGNWRSK